MSSVIIRTSDLSKYTIFSLLQSRETIPLTSVAEPHHFYAAPAAPAPAAPNPAAPNPAPTLQYSRATFLKRTKV
jgi:hypothetical protein